MDKKKQQLINKAIKQFKLKRYDTYVCDFRLVRTCGKLGPETFRGCHVGLRRGSRSLCVLDGLQKGHSGEGLTNEQRIVFVDFLVNRSIYQHAYLEKSVSKIMKDGIFVMNPEVNYNYMSAACVANRSFGENASVIPTWIELTQHGIDENLSFILSHVVNFTKDRFTISKKNGHSPINGNITRKNIKLFMNYLNTDDYKEKTYNDNPTYDKIHYFFAKIFSLYEDHNIFKGLSKGVATTKNSGFFSQELPIFRRMIKKVHHDEITVEIIKLLEQKLKEMK